MTLEITHRFVAETALAGMGIDVLGGYYLAYDLLGGKRGPLRTLARTAGNVALFFVGNVVLLGLGFAIVASLGMGILLPIECHLATVHTHKRRRRQLAMIAFGVLRGIVLGLAAMTIAGTRFGVLFGLLTGVGLSASYLAGYSPIDQYEGDWTPRISRHKILTALWRALIFGAAGVTSGVLQSPSSNSLLLGLKLGVAAGVVSALVSIFSPRIEGWIESLPERHLGVIGLGLIFLGMLLQSVQYWLAIWA